MHGLGHTFNHRNQQVAENDRIGNALCGTAEETEDRSHTPRQTPYTYCPLGVIGVVT